MLVSNTMIVEWGSIEALRTTSSRFLRWDFLESMLLLSDWKKEKWLENRLTNLLPGENSGLKGSKDLKIPFNLLFASTIGPLTFNFYLLVKFSIDSWWWTSLEECLASNKGLMMWLGGSEWVWSWSLPLNFWRCKCVGTRPAIASMPDKEEVWNAPSIHRAALHCIALRTLSGYDNRALL